MTRIIVEVGPATVRGPNDADPERVSAGIDDIDDELTLVDECPVAVAEVWRTVMHEVVGGCAETIVLVCPTWWVAPRIDCVRDAAGTVAADVLVLQRTEVLRDGLLDRLATVVEIAPELVLVSPAGGDVHVAPRGDVDAVVARIPISTSVVVDAAEGVAGAVQFAATIADRLRAKGVAVSIADRDWVLHSVESPPLKEVRDPQVRPSTNPGRRATAVVVGALLSAVALCGGFMSRHDVDTSHAGMPMTLVVEGRVGVLVPAQWVVQRVTAGPGSARLQVVSPTDVDIAIHVTQSSLAPHSSQDTVAASLRDALGEEAVGLFVDFNPSDRWADRPVVTYREMRAGHSIAWAVLIDKSARIAIGCQSAPGQEETVREVCDRAIRSAHAVF